MKGPFPGKPARCVYFKEVKGYEVPMGYCMYPADEEVDKPKGLLFRRHRIKIDVCCGCSFRKVENDSYGEVTVALKMVSRQQ